MASEYGPGQVIEDTYLAEIDPGMAQAAAQVREGLAVTTEVNRQVQQASAKFINEYGADVLGGHTPINPPPTGVNQAGTGVVDSAGED